MPKIAAGSNATVSVPAGSVVSVSSGGGLLRFEFPSGTVLFEGDGVDQTFGPFSSSGNALITSLMGGIDYAVTTPPAAVAPFTPSNVDIRGGSIAAGLTDKANTFVLFGDSITANNMMADSAQVRGLATGYFTAANVMLGHRAIVLNYAGISGNTTTQMVARIGPDVLAYSPGWCVVLGGINDIAAGATAAQVIANLQTIYQTLTAAGIRVVACTVMPSSLRITTPALHTLLHTVNAWIKTYAQTSKGVTLADFHAAFADPATGAEVSTFSKDQLHPNIVGAWSLGRCLFEVLDPLLPKLRILPSSPTDYKNLVYNPLAVGNNASGTNSYTNGTGITGNGPNGWTTIRSGTGTGVASKVARTDYWQGEWAQMALTATAASDAAGWTFSLTSGPTWFGATPYALGATIKPGNGYRYRATTGGTSGGTQPTWPTTAGLQVTDSGVTWTCVDLPTAGDTIEGYVEFYTSGFSGPALVEAYIECIDAGSAVLLSAGDNVNVDAALSYPSFVPASGILRIPQFTAPATTNSMVQTVRVRGGAGVTGNFGISRVGARLLNR